MKQEEIIEGNKLIAEFMECEKSYRFGDESLIQFAVNGWNVRDISLTYHSNWNWLMSVVGKIEKVGNCRVIIHKYNCEIKHFEFEENNISERFIEGKTKIESVWLAVVEFIKRYNQK